MGKSPVTKNVADFINRNYEALRIYGQKREKAITLTKSDVKKEFGIDLGPSTIEIYSIKDYEDTYRSEFLNSLERFERGEPTGKLRSDNTFLRTLAKLSEYDSIKGVRLAEAMKVKSVRRELRELSIQGLSKLATTEKSTITERGRDYLKSIGIEIGITA